MIDALIRRIYYAKCQKIITHRIKLSIILIGILIV